MYIIVKRLRDKGVLRTPQAITNDEGRAGELRFASSGAVPTATLHDPDDDCFRPIIPRLEHAQLITMQVDMMRFRGVERTAEGAGYEQEWSVKIIGYQA
jgi:hypothetical protein